MSARKNHTEKMLQRAAKRASAPTPKSDSHSNPIANLREQYDIIRADVQKLRDDVMKGYVMAKGLLDINSVKGLLRSK